MAHIEGANLTIMVSDMDVAIRFYTDILGFHLKNRYGDHWADIEGPGIAIGLHPAREDLARGENMQIGLQVSALEQAVSELEQKGLKFTIRDDDQVRLAFFTDPDGNILYLAQSQG